MIGQATLARIADHKYQGDYRLASAGANPADTPSRPGRAHASSGPFRRPNLHLPKNQKSDPGFQERSDRFLSFDTG